jgi:hypothetical protein
MKLIYSIVLIFLCATNTFAFTYSARTGNEYYSFLKSPETVDSLMAMEFMFGVIDTKITTYCIPSGVTPGQLQEIVTKYIEQQPEKRHLVAAMLIEAAIKKSFPCRTSVKP